MAGRTGQLIHVATHDIAGKVAAGLVIATVDIGDDTLKWNVDIALSAKVIDLVKMKLTLT